LETHLDHSTDPPIKRALVQWLGLPLEETSWENWDELVSTYHLEDKVTFQDPGDVSNAKHTPLKDNDTDPGPIKYSKRAHKQPRYLDDYKQ
jgi:ABC-type oligopeptide transport system substrate-binding subunit